MRARCRWPPSSGRQPRRTQTGISARYPRHGDAAAKLAADVVFCPAQGNRMLHLPAHGDRDAPGITACHGMTLIRQPYLVMSPPLRRCGRLCRPGWRSAALAHKPVLGRNVPGTSGA